MCSLLHAFVRDIEASDSEQDVVVESDMRIGNKDIKLHCTYITLPQSHYRVSNCQNILTTYQYPSPPPSVFS